MASQSAIPISGSDVPPASGDDRIAAFDHAEDVEPVQPSFAARQQALGLVGRLPPPRVLVAGAAAVVTGGAVGYWLGSRSTRKPVQKVKRTASSVGLAVQLAPVAIQLLANPTVRSLAIKLAMRRLAS